MTKKIIYLVLSLWLIPACIFAQSYYNLQPDAARGLDVNISSKTPTFSDGNNEKFIASNTTGSTERAIIKFDLASLPPGVDIISARLLLYGVDHRPSSNGEGVLQMVMTGWDPANANWNNSGALKNYDADHVQLSPPSSTTQNYDLNVTAMVQKMVNTPLVNFGWMLYMADESGGSLRKFAFGSSNNPDATRRPKLEITYCDHLGVKAYLVPASDADTQDGSISLDVTGGVPPYTYHWSNNSTTRDISEISTGLYEVTVTDSRDETFTKMIPAVDICGGITYTILAPNPKGGIYSDARVINPHGGDNNTPNSNYESQGLLRAKNESNSGGGNSISRSMFAFDLSALPTNATISNAQLILSDDGGSSGQPPCLVQLCPINGSWNERTVTYNNQPDYATDPAEIIEFEYTGTQEKYTLDITQQLQKMVLDGTTANGWMLKLRDEGESSAGISAKFYGGSPYIPTTPKIVVYINMAVYECNDNILNWYQEDTYDQNGVVTGSKKTYLDNLGRITQELVKNASNEVFRTQTLYDGYGRPAITTLPAYTGSILKYQHAFMLNTYGQPYRYADFDVPGYASYPNPIKKDVINTLGYYYSDNNMYDAFQAKADNPYTRIEYSSDPGSPTPKRISKPGNAFKMGSGRESYNFVMTSGNELQFIYGNNISYKATRQAFNKMDCTPMNVGENIMATKQIEISPDNLETITYSIGDKVIATCYSGLSAGEVCSTIINVRSVMSYYGTRSTDIHLPDADKNNLYFTLPLIDPNNAASPVPPSYISYTVTDLYTDQRLFPGTDYTIVFGTRQVAFTPAFLNKYPGKSLFLRIRYELDPLLVSNLEYNNTAPPDGLVTYNLSYGRFTKNYYDLGGNLRKTVNPKGFSCATPTTITMANTFDYDHNGLLIAKSTPDEGLTEMVYDDRDNLRFTQNSKQYASNSFSYINYDKHDRPIESGENQSNQSTNSVWFTNYYNSPPVPLYPGILSANFIRNSTDGLLPANKSNVHITSYSKPSAADDIPVAYANYNQYRKFRNGEVNFIKNANSIIWYNYDQSGHKIATITQITEPDFVAKNPNLNDRIKTLEVTYDNFNGNISSNLYQRNTASEKLYYQYTYDANSRNTLIQLTYGTNSTPQDLSTFVYNKMGKLKRSIIGNRYQGIDFVYTLEGKLKAINHPGLNPAWDPGGDADDYTGTSQASSSSVNKDLFGEIVEYYNNDYERNNTNISSGISAGASKYDGLIYASRFKTEWNVHGTYTGAPNINGQNISWNLINVGSNYYQQELRFDYAYDEFNQLAKSTFGVYNSQSNSTFQRTEYAETGASGGNITYDKNGNITRLVRKAYNSEILDDLTYTYASSNNRLGTILDASTNSYNSSFNFETPSTSVASSFVYNSIGELVQSSAENVSTIDYFPGGKIKKITFTNGNTTEYEYDAEGKKLKSKFFHLGSGLYKYAWYVGPFTYEYDGAAVTPAFEVKEVAVPGGVIRVPGGTDITTGYLVYHVKDHLGNVRVSFKGNNTGNGIDVLSMADYYAFGGQLPGRIWQAEDYRYGYQGKPKGIHGVIWDHFELRQYNHDLGRWFVPDPKGQFDNPYIAMANNPVCAIDPDGGWALYDDIVAAVVGGVVNVVTNWSFITSGSNGWDMLGRGAALFAAGAVAGLACLYGGPLAGAAVGLQLNGLIATAYQMANPDEEIDARTMMVNGAMAGIAGGAAGQAVRASQAAAAAAKTGAKTAAETVVKETAKEKAKRVAGELLLEGAKRGGMDLAGEVLGGGLDYKDLLDSKKRSDFLRNAAGVFVAGFVAGVAQEGGFRVFNVALHGNGATFMYPFKRAVIRVNSAYLGELAGNVVKGKEPIPEGYLPFSSSDIPKIARDIFVGAVKW